MARAQGLEKLAGRVHPVFAQVFMILIYQSIGPCLAIPRTASTSFAMLAPLVGTGAGLQLGYSVVFFAAAFLVALRPERLTRWLGRLLCPCLLVLILVLFGGCLLHPLAGQYGTPTPEYTSGAVLQGVLYGYQTMDTLAALNFGAVIALNIQAQGITRQEEVQRSTILAGFVAGGLLLTVYDAGPRRSPYRGRRPGPCHRSRCADGAGRPAFWQSRPCAPCRYFCAGLL